MDSKLNELKLRLAEINDLEMAAAVLNWDQSTYMPAGGAPARARQMSTLARLAQEKFIDPAVGKLLDDLQAYGESLPYDSDDASLIRVTRRQYDKLVKVPAEFVATFYGHAAETYQAWTVARPANDFASIAPALEKTIDLSRKYAEFLGYRDHIADPLIDMADEGMKAASIQALFAELRSQLVPIARAITDQAPADDSCLWQNYPEEQQLAFGLKVIRCLGYDFQRGRQDKTHHPFMTKFSLGDVRITTALRKTSWVSACSAQSTSPGMPCMSRVSAWIWKAPHWPMAPLPACTKVNRACGRTWLGAAGASGNIFTRSSRRFSRIN